MFIGFRLLILAFIYVLSCLAPNLDILITIGGTILCTTLNIFIPVLFYNKAYQNTPRNRKLQNNKKEIPDDEQPLMEIDGSQNDENDCDPRLCTKIIAWIVLTLSTIIAIIGLIYII